MFCTQCGKEIADGNKFCGSCGSPVAVENFIEKEENNTQESRVQPEKDCMQLNYIKQTQNGMNEKSGTSKPHMEKKRLKIFLLCVVILIIIWQGYNVIEANNTRIQLQEWLDGDGGQETAIATYDSNYYGWQKAMELPSPISPKCETIYYDSSPYGIFKYEYKDFYILMTTAYKGTENPELEYYIQLVNKKYNGQIRLYEWLDLDCVNFQYKQELLSSEQTEDIKKESIETEVENSSLEKEINEESENEYGLSAEVYEAVMNTYDHVKVFMNTGEEQSFDSTELQTIVDNYDDISKSDLFEKPIEITDFYSKEYGNMKVFGYDGGVSLYWALDSEVTIVDVEE